MNSMTLPQQKFRELVFQLLYSQDVAEPDPQEMVKLLMRELKVSKKKVRDGQDRLEQIKPHLPAIDALLMETSKAYDFGRVRTVERNILRLAVYEMLFDETIPPKVAISEGIRLTRKFGTPEAANFVNALLDNVFKSQQGESADGEVLQNTAEDMKASEEESHRISLLMEEEKKRDATE